MRYAAAAFISVVVWCALTQRVVVAQRFGKSWEPCAQQNHCVDDFICVRVVSTLVDNPQSFTACGQEDNNATPCACLPLGTPRTCSSSTDCGVHEVCAIQTDVNGGLYCVSCHALDTQPFYFKPVEDNDPTCNSLPSSTPFATVTPSPNPSPPSRVGDYCFGVYKCDDESFCHGLLDPDIGCTASDAACRCDSPPYTSCSDSTGCNEGTACVLNLHSNTKVCVSCTAIAYRVNFIPVDDTAKDCEKMDPVPSPPVAFPIRNGQTYDYCRSASTCSDDRLCFANVASQHLCPEDVGAICLCGPPSFSTVCTSSSDCAEAEGCATLPGIAGLHCYSLGLINNLGPTNVKVFGHKELLTVENPGFSGSSCRFDWECAEPRRCTHRSEVGLDYGGCAGRSQCTCESLVPVRCAADDDCNSSEEVCVHIIGARTSSICRSAAAVEDDPLYERVGADTNATVSETSGDNANSSGGRGLSGDICVGDSKCVSGICRHVTEQNSTCDGRDGCFCVPRSPSCAGDTDCESGEQCVVIEDQIPFVVPAKCLSIFAVDRRRTVYVSYASVMYTSSSPFPLQPSVEPSESPDELLFPNESSENPVVTSLAEEPILTIFVTPPPEPDPCVDVKALAHMSSADLVFKYPRRANVLCDTEGSCATPGHFVEWNGCPMTMQSYCTAVASCLHRIIWVNSPRMRAGLRVTSRTNGLKFTALAARYGSRLEEHIMGVLLRIGF